MSAVDNKLRCPCEESCIWTAHLVVHSFFVKEALGNRFQRLKVFIENRVPYLENIYVLHLVLEAFELLKVDMHVSCGALLAVSQKPHKSFHQIPDLREILGFQEGIELLNQLGCDRVLNVSELSPLFLH